MTSTLTQPAIDEYRRLGGTDDAAFLTRRSRAWMLQQRECHLCRGPLVDGRTLVLLAPQPTCLTCQTAIATIARWERAGTTDEALALARRIAEGL